VRGVKKEWSICVVIVSLKWRVQTVALIPPPDWLGLAGIQKPIVQKIIQPSRERGLNHAGFRGRPPIASKDLVMKRSSDQEVLHGLQCIAFVSIMSSTKCRFNLISMAGGSCQ
jgi:hypothetical protein